MKDKMSPKALRKIYAMQKHLNNDIAKIKNDKIVSLPETSRPAHWDNKKNLDYQQTNRKKLLENKQAELKWVDKIIKNNT